MNKEITAFEDALFIYNNCIDLNDAKKHFSSDFWLNQPVFYKQGVWRELIDLCENHGYFEGVA